MKEEITAAISAHRQWKQRLADAIATGKSEFKPDIVKQDSQCQFGKWLYGSITAAEKSSPHYAPVKEMHAKFHQEASRILAMATSGKKEEAKKAIDVGSEYMKLSTQLVNNLTQWAAGK